MCGIIGLISPDKKHHERFSKAAREIAPRGNALVLRQYVQESYGYSRLPTDGVGDRTLEEIGDPPSFLLFNGLLTNTEALCSEFKFSPKMRLSDHRCLQAGWTRQKDTFIARCRGMFACAFISELDVTLVRDTVGIKPLYYVHEGAMFAFASEAKALQVFSLIIHEVPTGGIVRFTKESGTLDVRRFSYHAAVGSVSLEELLYESTVVPTKRYLDQAPDKHVAVLLSGGVDSSVLSQLLVNYLSSRDRRRIVAFSIGHPESSDMVVARRLAKRLGLAHVQVPLPEEADMLKRLKNVVYRTESPYARVTKVALLYSELANAIKRQDIDVVLGGEGADELFFGYHRFIDGLTHQQSQRLFESFYKEVFPHTLLQRFDRIFAGRQIEGRVPFLDQAVIEYASRLSATDKVQRRETGHVSKVPLRRLARQIGLPEYVNARNKEKMTAGATGKDNTTDHSGYLEQAAMRMHGKTFQALVKEFYATRFPSVVCRASLVTEEALAEEAELFKKVNHIHQGVFYENR